MKKFLFIFPISTVALFAFFLNGGWYVDYFESSGYPGALPVLMAVFFISSELVLWAFASRKNPVSVILKYGLVLFSIFATLSSQFAATSTRESESAKVVYEEIDNSSDINWYKDQIEIQNNIINDINKMRAEKLVFTLSEDSMIKAETKRDEYENKLEILKSENKEDVRDVFQVDSIYGWFAVDLPRIFKSGVNEEFVRVMFQLFSSMILAFMAPVCISILRSYKPTEKQEKPEIANPQAIESEIKVMPEPVEIKFPEYKPEPKISDSDKLNILKMLLYYYRDESSEEKTNLEIMFPEKAVEEFKRLNKERPTVKVHSLENCREIYDEIIKKGLIGKDKEFIKKEIIGL